MLFYFTLCFVSVEQKFRIISGFFVLPYILVFFHMPLTHCLYHFSKIHILHYNSLDKIYPVVYSYPSNDGLDIALPSKSMQLHTS